MKAALSVQVHFDLICPWCFIGKRQLDAALARFTRQRPEVAVEVLWVSHELLPDTPPEGLPYQAFYDKRLGGPAAVAARRAQVQQAAHGTGIRFAFERIERLPNTRLAHRLLGHLQRAATGEALIERLFQAYFVEGRDIGDPALLARLTEELPIADTAGGVRHRVAAAGRMAVPGVPLFVFDERVALSGAQPPGVLLAQMHQAVRPQPLAAAMT